MEFLLKARKLSLPTLTFLLITFFTGKSIAQCSSANLIHDPADFQWTFHPVGPGVPQAYYSGTMEVGDTTFTFSNGETLTTRAYKQKGQPYSIPGPTLRMTPGNKYVLRLHNLLPYEAKSMQMNVYKDPNVVNLHTHGLHISGESPADDVHRSFEGGRGGDFVYDIPADHMGGTFWYHAHHHGATTLQVSGGMMGMIVIDDSNDNIPASVASMEEKVLQMAMLDPTVAGLGGDQLISGTMSGMRWIVNGIIGGEICMPPNTWQHWRVSVADPMAMLRDVSFGPECEVMVLARDGVWRTVAPLELTSNSIQLTGASRADFAIRASANSWVKMGNMTIANIAVSGPSDPAPHPYDTDGVSQWSAVRPTYLRDLRNVTNVHTESISMGARTVNGSKFDHMTPNITLPTTDVQEWSLSGNVRHPFHLHIYHVQALVDDRDFEAGEYYDVVASQMDVRFDLNAATTTTFSGHTIMHCHILEHEDQGAMGWLNVVGGQGPPTFPVDSNVTDPYLDYYILGGGAPQAPASASNLTAVALSSSAIDLSWDDNSSNEDGFNIESSLDGNTFTALASVGPNTTSYSDVGLSAATTYYYRVTAYNSVGNASVSNTALATTLSGGGGGGGGNATIHVDNIVVSRGSIGGGRERGLATVSIMDDSGNPVANATVDGSFTGPSASNVSGITGSNGEVSFNTRGVKNANGEWCFEVTNVALTGANYDPNANVVNLACESGPVSRWDQQFLNNTSNVSVYPNPFEQETQITFELEEKQQVIIELYSVLGQNLATIANQKYSSGVHAINFEAKDLPVGAYFLKVQIGNNITENHKIILR